MTDSSDPRRPKSSRKKPSREPATIDLKATVIDEGSAPVASPGAGTQDTLGQETLGQDMSGKDTLGKDTLGKDTLGPDTLGPDTLAAGAPAPETITGGAVPEVKPDETIAAGHEPPAEDLVASPEATLDSGAGTDTLPSSAAIGEAGRPDAGLSDSSYQESTASNARDEAVPPRPVPERRGSAGALIGSGLLGGVIGAGLLYGLQTWQENPGQNQPVELRLAQLEQRVGALRQPAPSPSGQPQGNVQALTERLQTLESARGELDQRLQAIQDTARQAASQAQEALNRPMPEAPQPPPAQNEAALTDLSNRLTELSNGLSGRLSGLEEQAQANAQGAEKAANAAQQLDGRIADLDRRLADQDRRFGEAERRFSETERRFTDTDRRISEQEQRLATLSQQAAENTRNAEAASQTGTKVVLAGRLNDALNSGTPYAEVLDGVKKAGADPSRVAPLEPFAEKGAPTAAALARSFDPVETAILRESRGPTNSWSDRLLRMADRVVTVKPVNEQGTTGVSALVVRIRQALERGDVVEAATAWDALPEPSRRLSEEWGRQVKAVAEAHRAAQAISSDALATLNRTTQ
ncbi:hypothetical protein [Microvirga lotononidis]|uniref:Uncharacterized protein n=1 Tax=Microvirga lotononidis TaxID=864069 RepID=I4YMT1_9HYPH|nr:hypothetical protein [Microvirga lotononidis]EIM25273.1 hypothetical protein MicloDRAFT_00059980 [Microvirga lotononidis]WQO29249.1 hypothetical protein U0023_09355 [Microvirga lotononidis]